MDVDRVFDAVGRGARRGAAARRYGLGSRVLAAREPKLLRAATRLASARTRVSRAPSPDFGDGAAYMAAPSPMFDVSPAGEPTAEAAPAVTAESLGLGPASFEWLFGDPAKALSHPDVTAGPVVSLPSLSPAERSARRVSRLTARGGSAHGRGARISEGPAPRIDSPAVADAPVLADAPAPAPVGVTARAPVDVPAPAPADTPASVAAPASASAPADPPAPRVRVARTAKPEPPSPATPSPPAPTPGDPPAPVGRVRIDRVARVEGPSPAASSPSPTVPSSAPIAPSAPPAPSSSSPVVAAPAVAPAPARRLVLGRRPATAPAPEPATASAPEPATTRAPEPATAPALEVARTPDHAAPGVGHVAPGAELVAPGADLVAPAADRAPDLRRAPPPTPQLAAPHKPPPPPSPGPPPVRPLAAAPARPVRPQIDRRRPTPPARPTVQRAARPAPAPAHASLLRRALTALRPRSRTDFGVPASTYVASAPKSAAVPVARMTLGTRSTPVAPPPLPTPTVEALASAAVEAPLWTPAEQSPAPPAETVSRPQQPEQPQAAPPPTPPSAEPDAAYRDLLQRVREEREQLGQIVDHPF